MEKENNLGVIEAAYDLIHRIESFKYADKKKIRSRIRISRYLLKAGRSVDAFADADKEILANDLITLEAVEVLFREIWYKDYFVKGADVSKFHELGEYFEQVNKHKEILNTKKQGKQSTKANIKRDIRAFRGYMSDIGSHACKRDSDRKMLRYTIGAVLYIEEHFDRALSKSEEHRVSKLSKGTSDLIDTRITEARIEQGKRPGTYVEIVELPMIMVSAS